MTGGAWVAAIHNGYHPVTCSCRTSYSQVWQHDIYVLPIIIVNFIVKCNVERGQILAQIQISMCAREN